MRFKLDENLPSDAAGVFRGAGHDAVTVLDQAMGGAPDPNVAEVCRNEGRVLVTLDTDFADIRAYPPSEHPGLLVLRLRKQDKTSVLDVLRRVMPLLETEPLAGRLWIVDGERIRVRS
ncbi:MAG: DUF5615 family PIN-like protein [Bacteroidota bacterium]